VKSAQRPSGAQILGMMMTPVAPALAAGAFGPMGMVGGLANAQSALGGLTGLLSGNPISALTGVLGPQLSGTLGAAAPFARVAMNVLPGLATGNPVGAAIGGAMSIPGMLSGPTAPAFEPGGTDFGGGFDLLGVSGPASVPEMLANPNYAPGIQQELAGLEGNFMDYQAGLPDSGVTPFNPGTFSFDNTQTGYFDGPAGSLMDANIFEAVPPPVTSELQGLERNFMDYQAGVPNSGVTPYVTNPVETFNFTQDQPAFERFAPVPTGLSGEGPVNIQGFETPRISPKGEGGRSYFDNGRFDGSDLQRIAGIIKPIAGIATRGDFPEREILGPAERGGYTTRIGGGNAGAVPPLPEWQQGVLSDDMRKTLQAPAGSEPWMEAINGLFNIGEQTFTDAYGTVVIDPRTGEARFSWTPEGEKLVNQLLESANATITQIMGADPDRMSQEQFEATVNSLEAQRDERYTKLIRALYTRGLLGLSTYGEAFENPFTGEMESYQLEEGQSANPYMAAFFSGIERENSDIARQKMEEAQRYLDSLYGSNRDIFDQLMKQHEGSLGTIFGGLNQLKTAGEREAAEANALGQLLRARGAGLQMSPEQLWSLLSDETVSDADKRRLRHMYLPVRGE